MKRYKKIIIEICISILLLGIGVATYILTSKDIFITVNGKEKVSLNIGEDYKEDGLKVLYCTKYFKKKCIDISDKVASKSNIDNKTIGEYVVDYNIIFKGIKKEIKRNVSVSDTEAPVITLVTSENSYTCPNQDYIEEGFEVKDNYDKDLKDKVKIEKGKFGWTYTVTDSSGNKASVYREFKYNDLEKPNISLKGYNYVFVKLNGEYKESGYTASDNCDGDITNKVVISGNVDTSKEGTYTITYNVKDNKGNDASTTRTVRVYSSTSPYSDVIPNGKTVYLTFDDGPCMYTGRLLEILDAYNVKATFFVTNQFPSYYYYIKEAHNKGHSIGLHTASHKYEQIYSSIDAYFKDLGKVDDLVFNQIGVHSKLIRFPGGSSNTVSWYNRGIMTALSKETEIRGYKYFDWNIGSDDTAYNSTTQSIANTIIGEMKNKTYSIVLQHDLYPKSIEAVKKVIEYGLANGYTFLPLTTDSPTAHHTINN